MAMNPTNSLLESIDHSNRPYTRGTACTANVAFPLCRGINSATAQSVTVTWESGATSTWSICGLGSAKRGRDPVPTAFIPMIDFALSSAVVEDRLFDTADDAEAHARSL